jgi:predicted amidohydrolase
MSSYRIGAIQLCSVLGPEKNLKMIQELITEGKILGIKYFFLPEVFYSMSGVTQATPYLVEGENEHYQAIRDLAIKNRVYLLGGSAATKVGDKIINRSYNFAPDGHLIGTYDKRHLFSCDFVKDGNHKKINEADVYTAGNQPAIIEIEELKIGLSICFDLRFSPLYWDYAQQGVNLISISSAFTVPTGKAHWHTLVRARAIETQSFVVATDQWGLHNEKVQTFGHSLIVSPWGDILADAKDGEKLIWADIDLDEVYQMHKMIHVYNSIN